MSADHLETNVAATDRRVGLLRRDLQIGVVVRVAASQVEANVSTASAPSGAYVDGRRHGRGEVGELVLVEGQRRVVLARITSIRVAERERKDVGLPGMRDVVASLQLLGSIDPFELEVDAGIDTHPRVGDFVYAAPHSFVAEIPQRLQCESGRDLLEIGEVQGSKVRLSPESLFARHCAVLGATGGGKSWTVARLVEELAKVGSAKVVLLDATGEYRGVQGLGITHVRLAVPPHGETDGCREVGFPPDLFEEHDFFALFQPSGRSQAPKLREAIKTLRLAAVAAHQASVSSAANEFEATYRRWGPDCYVKSGNEKFVFESASAAYARAVESPRMRFDVQLLADQLLAECVYESAGTATNPDHSRWGALNPNEQSYCFSLSTRIRGIVRSVAFRPVFSPTSGAPSLQAVLKEHLGAPDSRVLRIDLSGLSYEHHARPLIVNALGRMLLNFARGTHGQQRAVSTTQPLVLVVDEAHQFLGKTLGGEDAQYRLDAIELIAREGRKYGLCLCLATQRPRDVTESVLAQMGCFVVHRIVNDHDRVVIERASGEIDREAAAFLPSLRQGRAVIVGVDFPIPLTVLISRPLHPPKSDSADFRRRADQALEVSDVAAAPQSRVPPPAAASPAPPPAGPSVHQQIAAQPQARADSDEGGKLGG